MTMGKKTRKAIEELSESVTKTQKRNAKLFEEWAEKIVEALEEQTESNREMTRTLQLYLGTKEGEQQQAEETEETRSPSAQYEEQSSAQYERDSGAGQESATEQVADQEATDAAERKAEELEVDLDEVEGTGSSGRIVVGDVEKAAD
jgi:pyruvate/2-oxoglutarate dehydrogenase complex dihydrolipoamide acyltransferase (E2) component